MSVVDRDVSIVFTSAKPIARDRVRVCSTAKHNRRPAPDQNLESRLEATWQRRLRENPRLWNGTKFRVDRVESSVNSLILHLGITCYRDFLSTNWAEYADQLQSLGRSAGNEQMYLSDALGVGALLLSADGRIVLLRRSHHCAEAVGCWDVPGGHAEPEMLVGKKSMDEIRVDDLDEQDIVDEIFDSILREITDEVNIPVEHLSDPCVMGVAGNNTSAGRPSVEFLVRCSLTAEEIVRRYNLGSQAEADESTSILTLDAGDVLQLQNSSIWPNLAPSGKGCFHLYSLMQRDEDVIR